MNREIIVDEVVERRMAMEALDAALLEWSTKKDTAWTKPRASAPDSVPPDKAGWLKAKVHEILEAQSGN